MVQKVVDHLDVCSARYPGSQPDSSQACGRFQVAAVFLGLVGLQELQVQKRTSPLQEWDFDVLDQFEHSIISLGYVT